MLLSELANGASAAVGRVFSASPDVGETMLRRLGELGFISGEPVQMLRCGPGGREPLAVGALGRSLATAYALLAWFVFAPQCLSTLAVVKRETNSWRYPLIMAVYLFALAYVAAWATFRVTLWLGG
jgi:Fe2+ transport system protein FeoA